MGNESRIEQALRADEPALITYVTAGDPDAEATKEYVRALARGGADVIELGLPFSEPIAEGATIQAAIRRSLDAGMTSERFFDLVRDLEVDVPLVAMTYYNLLFRYGRGGGPEDFVEAAAAAGLSGIIVPDIPVEESEPLREACEAHGLDLIYIVAPTTEGDRLDGIMARTAGFAYVQARLGTTGARGDVSAATHESLARLAEYDVPKAVGFGVSNGEQAAEIIGAGADGVIVGSALVDLIAEGDGEQVADRLESLARELKEGAVAGKRQRSSKPEQP